MIHRTAASLAKLWAKNGVVPANEMEAYQYGLELLLSSAANIAVMVILSAVASYPWFFIPYLAAFIPLRLSAGGYHAKHHLSCILFNAVIYGVSLMIVTRLAPSAAIVSCFLESCLSLTVIFLIAPVPVKNKPLSSSEKEKNRRLSLGLGFLYLALCVLFYYTNTLALVWCKMIFCGQAAATLLLIIEKVFVSIRCVHISGCPARGRWYQWAR